MAGRAVEVDAERWQRARQLFDAAVDRDPAGWDELLAHDPDPEVRAEARALLDADRRNAFSQRADQALGAVAQSDLAAEAGRRFGAWQLLRPLGQGGMGTVWLAERIEGGFTQRAALKRVRPGYGAEDLLVRFRYERQILANLEHPNIARLIDGGAGPEGEPFLALEYVEGEDLRAYCDARRLGVEARLRLFLTVCDAVAHAHSRLVVHRDLKPSNILVTQEGAVKLLDFGVAKLLDAERGGEATALQSRVFTPAYAAPEQVRGEASTTAVDVYSLGVVLYELLVGRRPYGLEADSAGALEHAVLTQEPARPSSFDADPATAERRDLTPPQLRARLRGDLDAIVLKALRKEPTERYASARLLADDVMAHLTQRPVAARRGGTRYLLTRFVQRHALAAGFAALALLALLAGLGVALWQAQETGRQRDAARAEARKAEQALAFMQDLFELADPSIAGAEQVTARELLARGSTRIREELQHEPAVRAALLRAMGEAQLGLGLYPEALPLLKEAYELNRDGDDQVAQRDTGRAYGRALYNSGEREAALAVLEPLRAGLTPRSDAEALDAASLDYLLGLCNYALGRYAPAEAQFRSALAVRERLLGLAHGRTQDVIGGYVALLELHGRHEEALPLVQRGLAALPASAQPDPRRVTALDNIAMVKANLGADQEVEALRREALDLAQRIYGDEHLTTASTVNDLAAALFAQRRYAEAAPLFARTVAVYRQRLGAEHPRLALALHNQAAATQMQGDATAALRLAEEALAIRLAKYGPDHNATNESRTAVGSTLLDLGRVDEAQAHLEQVLRAQERLFDAKNPRLGLVVNLLTRAQLARVAVPADCGLSARAVALAEATTQPKRIHYARALHGSCRARRGEASGVAEVQAALEAYRPLVRPDDYYLPVMEALLRQAQSR
jgi:serine/threonine protein kinase